MNKKFLQVSTIAAGLLLGCASAFAVPVTVVEGISGGSGDVDNVLYQLNQTGNTVNATVNQNPGFLGVFSSNEELTTSGGQASLVATDGQMTTLSFSLTDGATFTKLIINPDGAGSTDGLISFVVDYILPAGVFNSASFTLDAQGNNFFTILAGDGARLTQVTWTSTIGVADANQYRVGGLQPGDTTSVPEGGATVAMLGLALTGLGFLSRRIRK